MVTFEPHEQEQNYIPLLKALMCGITPVGGQGCGCMATFCHAPLKIVVLLHKKANASHSFSGTVNIGTEPRTILGGVFKITAYRPAVRPKQIFIQEIIMFFLEKFNTCWR